MLSMTVTRNQLLIEIVGAVLFTLLNVVNAYVVFPTAQELDKLEPGDTALSTRMIISGYFFFPGTWIPVLTFVVMLREGCIKQKLVGASPQPVAPEAACAVRVESDMMVPVTQDAVADDVADAAKVDVEALLLTARLTMIHLSSSWIWLMIFGGSGLLIPLLYWVYVLFRVLPSACRRWNPTANPHRLMSSVRRCVTIGIPVSILPAALFPILKEWSPDAVIFWYPVFLSFIEYLTTSVLFNDKVVFGYSDEALSIIGRFAASIIEASRIGMLVVVTNSPAGTFGGLINATVIGLVTDALARNHLVVISMNMVVYGFRWFWWKVDTSESPQTPPHLPLNKLGRFEQVYIGVKGGTEYWGIFILILIKCLGWGYSSSGAPALDPNTGELLDVLNCPWYVIGVVGAGELTGDLLAWLLGWIMRRYAPPELQVDVPVITPRHPGLVLVMWLHVGCLFLGIISSMGVLSDSLEVTSS